MGLLCGLIKTILRWSIYLAVIAAFIIFIPNLPPYTEFTSIELESVQPFTSNGDLNNVQKLYLDKVHGPETFCLHNGELYTGLASGEVVKISPGGHVTFVTKIGQPCGDKQDEICGRPLGLAVDEKSNQLIVVDAYYGIWKVDLKTGQKKLLVSPRVAIDGHKPSLFNGIALGKNGDFYWTDSCSHFQLKDGVFCLMSDPSGRLYFYNAAKNESKVLVDNLWFANGVAISPDKQFVIVAETARFRLMKHYINGPNKGKTEVFVSGLPGTPDNVRSLGNAGALVGLYVCEGDIPLLPRRLPSVPLARKLFARIMRMAEISFQFLDNYFPNVVFKDIVFHIGHFQSISGTSPSVTGLAHIDWNGKIIATYFNNDKSIDSISDAVLFEDKLYLGGPHLTNYIGSVSPPEPLKKAFSALKTKKVQPETQKPKAAPKPTAETTTSKPVPKQETKPAPVKKEPAAKPVQPIKEETNVKKEAPTVQKKASEPAPQKAPTPKPTEAPKPKVAKPTEKPVTQKPPTAKPQTTPEKPNKPADPKPKPEVKAVPTKDIPKKVPSKTDEVKKPTQPKKTTDKKVPEQIPIEEEIVSDTIKPSKESLKVIKKEGPSVIPNPKP